MNYLISAYSINPYLGSESGVGWNWILQYEKHYKNGDRITVLTKKANELPVKKGIVQFGLQHIDVEVCDVPRFLNWYREKNSSFHHMYYILWQHQAWKWLKKTGKHYDVIHHVTWGDFRIPSELYKAKDSYTIWGPVGGAQVTPTGLKRYDTLKDKFRELVNIITVYNPIYKRQVRSFSKVFASNIETYEVLKKISPNNCSKLVEIGGESKSNIIVSKNDNAEVELLFVGRLIKKKGLEFLIEALAKLPAELNYKCRIYGEGELENKISKMISKYNLTNNVFLMGSLPHDEIGKAYSKANVFLLPSLRETGGTVLVEAMSYCLPIVALDQSFCHELSENNCGIFVNTNGSSENISDEFAQAIMTLANNPKLRHKLGMNGNRFVNNQMTWEYKFNKVYSEFMYNV